MKFKNRREIMNEAIGEIVGCLNGCKETYCPIDLSQVRKVIWTAIRRVNSLKPPIKNKR